MARWGNEPQTTPNRGDAASPLHRHVEAEAEEPDTQQAKATAGYQVEEGRRFLLVLRERVRLLRKSKEPHQRTIAWVSESARPSTIGKPGNCLWARASDERRSGATTQKGIARTSSSNNRRGREREKHSYEAESLDGFDGQLGPATTSHHRTCTQYEWRDGRIGRQRNRY